MKEAYAVRRTVPPSAEIEEQIDQLLAVGVGGNPREALSELAKLGARLIIQRAVEDEFDAWLGRARYERRPEAAQRVSPLSCCVWRGRAARRSSFAAGSWSSWARSGSRRRVRARRSQAIAPDSRHRRTLDHRGHPAQ